MVSIQCFLWNIALDDLYIRIWKIDETTETSLDKNTWRILSTKDRIRWEHLFKLIYTGFLKGFMDFLSLFLNVWISEAVNLFKHPPNVTFVLRYFKRLLVRCSVDRIHTSLKKVSVSDLQVGCTAFLSGFLNVFIKWFDHGTMHVHQEKDSIYPVQYSF